MTWGGREGGREGGKIMKCECMLVEKGRGGGRQGVLERGTRGVGGREVGREGGMEGGREDKEEATVVNVVGEAFGFDQVLVAHEAREGRREGGGEGGKEG
jgi:hypothetical protein